jgi:ribosomal protein S18 acetylase RimI-like enzyme
MSVRIVRAGPQDWQRYRDIRLRALADAPDAYASSLEWEQGHTPARWQELLTGAETFLAVDGERTLGTATGWSRDGDAVAVVAMYVAPEARGQRLAHRLLDEVVRGAMARGTPRLRLEVATGNEPARRSYLAYGFTPTGREHPMDRDPSILEIEMELPLDAAGP